jgi:Smg protein
VSTGDLLRDRVLAIVTLIAQLVMEEREPLSEEDLVGKLLAVGFEAEEIDAAFSWMERLALQSADHSATTLTLPTNRVFSAEEARILSSDARGFLLRLRAMGVLDDEIHEEIVERALQSGEDEVGLKDLKAIIALTLFSRSHDDWRRQMDCLFEDDWTRLYH